jgi:hypothetical protein
MDEPVRWSDDGDGVIKSDNTAGRRLSHARGAARWSRPSPGRQRFPVIVPVQIAGHDRAGLRLVVTVGLLPPGGRRAGLLAHAYRPQLVGLSTWIFTGWLEVRGHAAVYAPHTSKGFVAPPSKSLLASVERAAGEVRAVAGPAP